MEVVPPRGLLVGRKADGLVVVPLLGLWRDKPCPYLGNPRESVFRYSLT